MAYAKRPFAGPQQVLDYVGRYTHRVAISNNRLIDIDNDRVQFHWKDYRDNSKIKIMDLEADEFIRRFLLHVLPEGFQRVRYYGFLANRDRRKKLALCRQHPWDAGLIPDNFGQGLSRTVSGAHGRVVDHLSALPAGPDGDR